MSSKCWPSVNNWSMMLFFHFTYFPLRKFCLKQEKSKIKTVCKVIKKSGSEWDKDSLLCKSIDSQIVWWPTLRLRFSCDQYSNKH
jgi:hypothetical protein